MAALGSHAEADDAAQDAFVLAWRRIASFRGEATFRTWLLTIAWRQAINRRRTLVRWWKRTVPFEDEGMFRLNPDVSEMVRRKPDTTHVKYAAVTHAGLEAVAAAATGTERDAAANNRWSGGLPVSLSGPPGEIPQGTYGVSGVLRTVPEQSGFTRTAGRTPEQLGSSRELRRDIVNAIRALSPKLRDTLLLTQSGDYSYGEIGTMLHVPVGTIKWRVAEARRLVKKRLQELGHGELG